MGHSWQQPNAGADHAHKNNRGEQGCFPVKVVANAPKKMPPSVRTMDEPAKMVRVASMGTMGLSLKKTAKR